MPNRSIALYAIPLMWLSTISFADGFAVDKVYHPYVEAMEQEIEWRVVGQDKQLTDQAPKQLHRLGYGRSFGDRWFGELYLSGEKPSGDSLDINGYEAELRYQLTEQGEYWADWGLIAELEKAHHEDKWEAAAGVMVEKELGRFSATANLLVISEWGGAIENETESRLAMQGRYRYSRYFEPGIEFHRAQDTRALGPVFLGDIPLGQRRNIHWELGLYGGLDSSTPDHSFRAGVEYEF